MSNDSFGGRQGGGRGGRNDYFSDPYRKTGRVSVNSGRQPSGGSTRPSGSGGGHNKKKEKRGLPIGLTIVIDILIAALIMLLFYVTNYGESPEIEGTDLSTASSVASVIPSSSETLSPGTTESKTGEPSATPSGTTDPNDWRAKFADKFSQDGQVHQDDHSYQSPNIYVNITKNEDNGTVYYVADIYVADKKYFKTAFGVNPDKLGKTEFVHNAINDYKGIIGISGDMCLDNHCLIIRNGKEYKKWSNAVADELVMYNDGTMKTFAGGYDWDEIRAQAPYQAWGFGPMLLDSSSQPMTKFNSTVAGKANPRSAIGYYEPGHYCFVTVDGRQSGYSDGYNMTQLSQLMYKLQCKVAFNLDGGATAEMAFLGEKVNRPSGNRTVSDIIYITDEG